MVRSCELCESPAKMYCDSDQAYLCWGCDFKVHSANFLVARHSRTLLCQRCQSPTPWSAAVAKLCPTITLCEKCFGEDAGAPSTEERESLDGDAIDGGDELDLDEDEAVEEEEEGENQVVPWSSSPPTSPPATSSSSSEDEFPDLPSLKRNRDSYSDLRFQENFSRSIRRRENDPAVVTGENDNFHLEKGITMPLKESIIPEPALDRNVQGRTGLIKESMERIEREIASDLNASARITGLCELGRNLGSV